MFKERRLLWKKKETEKNILKEFFWSSLDADWMQTLSWRELADGFWIAGPRRWPTRIRHIAFSSWPFAVPVLMAGLSFPVHALLLHLVHSHTHLACSSPAVLHFLSQPTCGEFLWMRCTHCSCWQCCFMGEFVHVHARRFALAREGLGTLGWCVVKGFHARIYASRCRLEIAIITVLTLQHCFTLRMPSPRNRDSSTLRHDCILWCVLRGGWGWLL